MRALYPRLISLAATAVVLLLASAPRFAVAADSDAVVSDVSKLDEPPKPIAQTGPKYPFDLRVQGIQGQSMVEFVVEGDGSVGSVEVVPSSQPEFGAAAVLNQTHRSAGWVAGSIARSAKPGPDQWICRLGAPDACT